MWANPEKLLLALLVQAGWPPERVSMEAPTDLEENLPFIKIGMVRGADDHVTDAAVLDVEYFGSSRSSAADGAEELRETVLGLAGRASRGRLVDSVSTVARPTWRDYRNSKIHRYVATYQITARQV